MSCCIFSLQIVLLRGLTGGQWDEGVLFSSREVKLHDYNESPQWRQAHWKLAPTMKPNLPKALHHSNIASECQVLLWHLFFYFFKSMPVSFFFWRKCHFIFYFSYHVYIFLHSKEKGILGQNRIAKLKCFISVVTQEKAMILLSFSPPFFPLRILWTTELWVLLY